MTKPHQPTPERTTTTQARASQRNRPNNRTARAARAAPDLIYNTHYSHKLGPPRAALRRRRPARRRPPRATARGLEPRAELLNGTPALLLFRTPERLARRRHEPGTCWDLRRSRCKRIHAGRRPRGRRRLLRGRRRPGRRLWFGAFHQFELLRRVQSSFVARFELQLPYFTVTESKKVADGHACVCDNHTRRRAASKTLSARAFSGVSRRQKRQS